MLDLKITPRVVDLFHGVAMYGATGIGGNGGGGAFCGGVGANVSSGIGGIGEAGCIFLNPLR